MAVPEKVSTWTPIVPGGKISYDDGLTARPHPTGLMVYMVKTRPGEFLNARGDAVSDKLAEEAGFPVERLVKERKRRELLAKAKDAIDLQLGEVEADMPQAGPALLADRNGYRVLKGPLGGILMQDPEGNSLLGPNHPPLSEEQALALLDKLVPLEPTP